MEFHDLETGLQWMPEICLGSAWLHRVCVGFDRDL